MLCCERLGTEPEVAFSKLLENHIFRCEGAAMIDYAEQQMQESQQQMQVTLFASLFCKRVTPLVHHSPVF